MTWVNVALAGSLSVLAATAVLAAAWRRGRTPPVVADGGTAVRGLTAHGKTPGLARWVTTVDHRDIGLLYIGFGIVAALWGGMDAIMLRTELLTPGVDVWDAETYSALFTTHGITMLFFFVTPVFVGIGNYVLPPLLGADDLAFPRINAVGFWILPPSLLLARAGLVTEVAGKAIALVAEGWLSEFLLGLEPPTTGWTLYAPLSIQLANPQIDLLLLGLHLSGVGTTLAAINFIVTILTERGDGVTWANLDILSWNFLVTSVLILAAFPVFGAALVMLLLDRNFGTAFFTVDGAGPMFWQHLFWFFGHPEVYIIVLPAFGLTSLILPKFARRRLFGFRYIVFATIAIGVLSFGVWAHHMFATGMDARLRASFMAVTIAIAVPSAIKEFNWIATIWNGDVRLTAPMILLLGSLTTFVVGGITGVFLASIPVDLVFHGTYYVVAHFHFIIVGIIPLAMFAACYYWFPLITGRMYDRRLAKVHAVITVGGVFVTFVPLFVLGFEGLPRRSAEYPAAFAGMQQVATVGAYVIGVGVAIWVYNMVQSLRVGPVVTDADVWDLKEIDQFTREWQWFEARLEADDDGPTPEADAERGGDGP